VAENLYELFVKKIRERGLKVATGKFRAMMDVHLVNWGPVTLMLDSKKGF
jgi:D-tyrosyl-tRNA(Tyr) deacylase